MISTSIPVLDRILEARLNKPDATKVEGRLPNGDRIFSEPDDPGSSTNPNQGGKMTLTVMNPDTKQEHALTRRTNFQSPQQLRAVLSAMAQDVVGREKITSNNPFVFIAKHLNDVATKISSGVTNLDESTETPSIMDNDQIIVDNKARSLKYVARTSDDNGDLEEFGRVQIDLGNRRYSAENLREIVFGLAEQIYSKN